MALTTKAVIISRKYFFNFFYSYTTDLRKNLSRLDKRTKESWVKGRYARKPT